jgi:HAD superfamily hydrolase (TIGR01509 family)
MEYEDSRLMTAPRALVFDLGGVLLHLNRPQLAFDLQMNESDFLQRWLYSASVRDFERGMIDAETFARSLVDEAELPYDWREFLDKFDSWPDKLYPGILDLLDDVASTHRCVLLSNTNAMHWERAGVGDKLSPRFEKIFLSYLTGQLKPDPDVYEMVQAELNCEPNQIVFFDDNPANVDAARDCGWQSFVTKGPGELKAWLDQAGILV